MKKIVLMVFAVTSLFLLTACGNGDTADSPNEIIVSYLSENEESILTTIGDRPNTTVEVVAGDNDTVIVYFHLDEVMSAVIEEFGDDAEDVLIGLLEGQDTLLNIAFMNLVEEIEAETLTVITRFTVNGESAAELAYEVTGL